MSQHALGWLNVDKQECKKWTNTFLFLPYMAVSWWLVNLGGERWGWELSGVSFWVWGSRSVTLSFRFLYESSSWVRFAGQWGRLQPRVPVELRRCPGM